MARVSSSNRLGYVRGLDGFRGLAIAAVVGFHLSHTVPYGLHGVHMFFVLSGFLITTLLVEEHLETGHIRLRSFYVRRARRLFPTLFAFSAAWLVITAARGEIDHDIGSLLAGTFYAMNVVLAFGGHPASHLIHLWSLAEEEQFYLLWPPILTLLLRRGTSQRAITVGLAVVVLGVVAERFVLAATGASGARIYYGPDTNADLLALGCLLALARTSGLLTSSALKVTRHAGMPALGFCVLAMTTSAGSDERFAAPAVGLASAVLIAGLVEHPDALATRLLCSRLLVRLGVISYSVYVWHPPLIPYGGLLTILVAGWLSYRYIEQPFRRRSAARREVALPALAAARAGPA